MRRSSSFPGAALNDVATDKLTSRLTAQLGSPAVQSGPNSSASSDDLDSESIAEDWVAADDASSPTRCGLQQAPYPHLDLVHGACKNNRSTFDATQSIWRFTDLVCSS